MVFNLKKLESPSPKDNWLKVDHWFWRRDFCISSMYFLNYVILCP